MPDALDRRLALSERISRTGGFELDPVTGELWVSQGMRRLLGQGADEPLQISHLLDLVHPEDRARCLAIVKAHRQRTEPFEFECRVVRPDGQVRDLTFRLETHESLLVGVGQDVTARTSAVEALRQTRERYRLGLSLAPVLIFEEDLCLQPIWVDKLKPGRTPGETLQELLPSEVLERLSQIKLSVLSDGEPHREELRFHRGGLLQSYDLSLDCRRDQRGKVVGLIVAAVDLGTQRRAEEEARLLRTAFHQSVLGVAITDVMGRVQYVNQRYGQLSLPASPREILPYFHPEKAPSGELLAAFLAGRAWEGDLGGDRRVSVGPVYDGEGNPTHFAVLVHDVSQERKGREELEQTRILLAQSQKMEAVGRLAGGMAHDFNNLLAVIQGNCSLLIEEVHDNDEAVDLLSQVLGASQRGACLTRQLLTFSRCHRKQWGRFDLNEALTEFVPMLRPLLGDKVRLALDCALELLPLQGDRGHLEQVVLNLVLNACDAMPTGGDLALRTLSFSTDLPVRCRSCELAPGEYLAVEVSDSGCGMSAETQRRIFEPFFTTRAEGTGLGLATAFGLVGDLKGGFQVESQPGRGSTFRLILPRLLETASTAVETELPLERQALEGCKVLLVEDLPDLRRLLDRLLRGRGFQVVTAGSGEEAEELFPLVEPRIVVSDLMLPGVNGVELAHRLAARDPCLRVLLMSGYGAELDPAGFPFMSKPFTPDQLVRRLQEVLAA